MHIKIITWSKIDNTVAFIVTWNDMSSFGNLNWVMLGQQVSGWRLPELDQPITADRKYWGVWLVSQVANSLGISWSVDDQTIRA